jgi:hypothetical protein
MGLDIVAMKVKRGERCGSWSYSGFNDFRTHLAKSIGITLDEMNGFGGHIDWPDAKQEPLVILLHHSDCDGRLDYWECEKIAPRLREVIATWSDDDVWRGYDKVQVSKLLNAMEAMGEYDFLEFS